MLNINIAIQSKELGFNDNNTINDRSDIESSMPNSNAIAPSIANEETSSSSDNFQSSTADHVNSETDSEGFYCPTEEQGIEGADQMSGAVQIIVHSELYFY